MINVDNPVIIVLDFVSITSVSEMAPVSSTLAEPSPTLRPPTQLPPAKIHRAREMSSQRRLGFPKSSTEPQKSTRQQTD